MRKRPNQSRSVALVLIALVLIALGCTACHGTSVGTEAPMSAVTSKLTRYGDLPAKLCVDVTGPEWAELKRGDRQLIFHIQNQRAIQAYVPPLVATLLGMGAEAPIALEPFSLHADRKSVGTVPVMQHFSFNLSDFLPATITGGPLCAQLALYGVERCPSEIRAEQVLVSITQERIPR